jgi:hypothetical protein
LIEPATYRILYIAHVWQAAIDVVHNQSVCELELNNKFIKGSMWVAHKRAHEGLCNFVRTEERRKERAVLGRRTAKNVPS